MSKIQTLYNLIQSNIPSVAHQDLLLIPTHEREGQYKLDFDNEVKPMDQVFEDKGVKIVTDLKSFLYLVNTELEFSDGLNGKGFYFNNPNASRSCGCGESFAV